MSASSWSLAITPPNRELSISRALSRWHYEHHVFKIRRHGVFRGRVADRLLPAFPGYLFVVAQKQWYLLRTIFGVVDFIGHGTPIGLAVNSLMRVADENGVIPTPEIQSRFHAGDIVIIKDGPFASQRAKFLHAVDETRVCIEVDMFGRYVPFPIDERDLDLETHDKPKPRRKRRHRRSRRKYRQEQSALVAASV